MTAHTACVCHRPAVFFRHLRPTALSFPEGKKIRAILTEKLNSFFTFLKTAYALNCVTRNCVSMESVHRVELPYGALRMAYSVIE